MLAERIIPALTPLALSRAQILSSPFQFVLQGEDGLVVVGLATVATTITLRGRIMRDDGTIEVFLHSLQHPGTGGTVIQRYATGRGVILHVLVAASGTVAIGQCFVRVGLERTAGGGVTGIGTVLQGYVTSQTPRAWPGAPLQAGTEGPGVLREIAGTVPGVITQVQWDVPAMRRWRVVGVSTLFVTDVNVGTRYLSVWFWRDNLAGYIGEFASSASQAALTSVRHSWAHGHAILAPAGFALGAGSLPTWRALPDGWHVGIVVSNFLGAGDTLSNPTILVEEWLDV